jgi:hypothetical protein
VAQLRDRDIGEPLKKWFGEDNQIDMEEKILR